MFVDQYYVHVDFFWTNKVVDLTKILFYSFIKII